MWVPEQPTALFWLRTISGQAWTGVYLFFLLSGFLIGRILLSHRAAENYYSVFYTRRAYRIFPLYFLLLGAFLSVRWIFSNQAPPEFAEGPIPLWSYFALVQNFPMAMTGQWGPQPLGVTWSVALEEQFYLFLPLWIRAVPVRWHGVSFLFLAAVGPVFRALSSWAHPPFLVPGSTEALFFGVFMAWLHLRSPEFFRARRARAAAATLLAIGAAGMLFLLGRRSLGPLNVTVITLFWGAFLWLVIGSLGRPATGWLRHRFLGWMGRISYGVYLFHPLVLSLVFLVATGAGPDHALGAKGFSLSLLTFAITVGLASLSFYGFERALIARGRRHKYRTPEEAMAARPIPAKERIDIPDVEAEEPAMIAPRMRDR